MAGTLEMSGKGKRDQDDLVAVKKCYSLLHSIEKCDKYVESFLQEFKEKLKEIFINDVKDSRRVLFDPEVLDGKFEGYSGIIPITKTLPQEKVYGETLLFRALTKYKSGKKQSNKENSKSSKTDTRERTKDDDWHDIIMLLIEEVPEMITFRITCAKQRKAGECDGYSPFYLAIVKKHTDVIKQMIIQIKKQKPAVEDLLAEGSTFGNTVMSAGTPLGVAALTMDKSIFRKVLKLYKEGGDIKLVTENSKRDNIIHSMIKYIKKNKDQLKPAEKMLEFILDADSWRITSNKPEDTVKLLTRSKNVEHLTPLQLAVKSQQFELFEILIKSKGNIEHTEYVWLGKSPRPDLERSFARSTSTMAFQVFLDLLYRMFGQDVFGKAILAWASLYGLNHYSRIMTNTKIIKTNCI